jgi:lipopolysaccharide export system protein LptC
MDAPEPDNRTPRGIRLIWISTLLSIGLGSFLLFEPWSEESKPTPARSGPAEPDLTLSEAVITSFRASGALKYVLRSPHIERFDAQDLTYLTEPDLEMHSAPDPPWRMTARRGTISNSKLTSGSTTNSSRKGGSAQEEQVFLEQDVRMAQHYGDGRSFELRTSSITLYPDREYAETDQDVMITTHAGRTTAVGLHGNLDQGLLQLSSNDKRRVHTILLPDQFK